MVDEVVLRRGRLPVPVMGVGVLLLMRLLRLRLVMVSPSMANGRQTGRAPSVGGSAWPSATPIMALLLELSLCLVLQGFRKEGVPLRELALYAGWGLLAHGGRQGSPVLSMLVLERVVLLMLLLLLMMMEHLLHRWWWGQI